jgi:transmembrane sensor
MLRESYIRRIAAVLKKYVLGRAKGEDLPAEDQAALQSWLEKDPENTGVLRSIDDNGEFKAELDEMRQIRGNLLNRWERLDQLTGEKENKSISRIRPLVRLSIAGCLIVFCIMGYWLYPVRWGPAKKEVVASNNDINPGRDQAVLTLADGRRVNLDSAKNGTLTNQGKTTIVKTNGGELAYQDLGHKEAAALIYNTLSTPNGGKYSLVLPDGSKVWLNAASSLTFPTTFDPTKREVTLKGEAFFEIKHLHAIPFVVHTAKETIEDLATSFNVAAYDNDPVEKTTLLTGSIRVVAAQRSVVLKPGEQTRSEVAEDFAVATVKTVQETAWMRNEFNFRDADLYGTMRQISRWYDVQVDYRGNVPNRLLHGSAKRDTKLSTVLNALSVINVHCTLQGHTVIVEP